MKEIIEDFKREQFTVKEWLVYGIIVPLLLIIISGLAGV